MKFLLMCAACLLPQAVDATLWDDFALVLAQWESRRNDVVLRVKGPTEFRPFQVKRTTFDLSRSYSVPDGTYDVNVKCLRCRGAVKVKITVKIKKDHKARNVAVGKVILRHGQDKTLTFMVENGGTSGFEAAAKPVRR